MSIRLFCSCIFLAFLCSLAYGESLDLMAPVAADRIQEISARNEYFIDEFTFNAKRFQIVELELDKLENAEEIRLSLFDDVAINLVRKKVEIDRAAGGLRWIGTQVSEPIVDDTIVGSFPDESTGQGILDELRSVAITVSFYEKDDATGAILNPIASPDEIIHYDSRDRYEIRNYDPKFVLGTYFYITPLGQPSRFMVRVLGFDGPFHLVTEIDPSISREESHFELTMSLDEYRARRAAEKAASPDDEILAKPHPHEALYRSRIQAAGHLADEAKSKTDAEEEAGQ